MRVEKRQELSHKVVPVIAALPYEIAVTDAELPEDVPTYDASQQRTIYAGRDYSTCREDDSVYFGAAATKADTKKDD